MKACRKVIPGMPGWQCHKRVQAAKITHADRSLAEPDKITFTFENAAPYTTHLIAAFQRSDVVGGYFVRYDDGYESWSPASAFESGYTLDNT